MYINLNPNWRYASRSVKFWKLDYRLILFFLLFLLHMRMSTLYFVSGVAIILAFLEFKYEYRVEAAFKRLFCFISGKEKPNVSLRRRNRTDR